MSEQLYHFFNVVIHQQIDEQHLITIDVDGRFEHLQYVYNHFGEIICPRTGYVYDVYPTLKNYFGGVADGFFDNLRCFLEQYPEYFLRVNIIAKHEDIDDADFFIFINSFLTYKKYYSGERLWIYVSSDILKWYDECCHLFTPIEEVIY